MIDFNKLGDYKENNRIEAKKAMGGLPKSVWETYSAFANTLGGIILLGVEELEDKTLRTVNLPDPEEMKKDFWNIINNPQKVSVNILSDKNLEIKEVNGNKIIAITVPRAQRYDKPIYIDGNPMTGTYRRNGEGDYKCTKEEVQAMMRDASVKTQDMKVLDNMDMDVFDYDSIRRYRTRMQNFRPGHVWEELEDTEFLYRLGAVGRGEDGKTHPTVAGLLMFGFEFEIIKEFPHYFLDYQEQTDEDTRWTDRVVSSSGEWSGNLYDFYFRVYNKIIQDIKVPFKVENGNRIDDTSVHSAFREALANCLVNADYYGTRGLVIVKKKNQITISNPGGFRIDIKDAKSGGVSDPRNAGLIKMFNMINVGERAGSGIPNIYRVWKNQGWKEPIISESFNPERITLVLDVEETAIKNGDKTKTAIKNGDKKKSSAKTMVQKEMIIDYITEKVSAQNSEIAELLGLKSTRVNDLLKEMVNEGILIAQGSNKSRVYKLKE